MNKQIPSIGRIVHYHSFGTPNGEYKPKPVAACVTQVDAADDHLVGLCIFNPTGLFFNTAVPYSFEPKPGHWSWPPHVAPKAEASP